MPKQLLTIIAFLFLFCSKDIHAQSFSFKELIQMHRGNFDEFDTKVLKKGFKPIVSKMDDSIKEKLQYGLPVDQSHYSGKILKISFKSGIIGLNYQVYNSDSYLLLKEEMKRLGFEYYRSENKNNATLLYYKNTNTSYDDIIIQVATGEFTNEYGKGTYYEFTLTNNLKL
jgi:hypothetical protein